MDGDKDSQGLQQGGSALALEQLVAEWDELRRRQMGENGSDLTPEEERRLWVLTTNGLVLFADLFDRDIQARLNVQRPLESQLMRHAAAGIRDALRGFLPAAWREKPRDERKDGLTELELEAPGFTASYYALIREGLFADDKRADFLAGKFGVSTRQIQKWARTDPGPRLAAWREYVLEVSGLPEDLPRLRREKMRSRAEHVAALRRQRLL
jgi:hypothetical protein